jgi:hypothetical protein
MVSNKVLENEKIKQILSFLLQTQYYQYAFYFLFAGKIRRRVIEMVSINALENEIIFFIVDTKVFVTKLPMCLFYFACVGS